MEFRNLQVFVEVVRQGGFTRAARTLHSTQSTVSKSVQLLEQQLGARLLDRIGQRNVLTAIGEIVFSRGSTLLADRENLMAEIAEVKGLTRGSLRLGLPPIGSNALFAPIFTAYRQRYPDISVNLVEHGSDELERALSRGEIDIGGLLLPISDDFDFIPMQQEPLTVLLPSHHRLSNEDKVRIADLRDDPFILFDETFSLHRLILSACHRQRYEPKVAAMSSQIDFVVELVSSGLGVSFLPASIALSRRRSTIAYVPLDEDDASWHMAMAWRRNGYLSNAALAWLELTEAERAA
jgi:DNA-binding transcriptional LysR family regulator